MRSKEGIFHIWSIFHGDAAEVAPALAHGATNAGKQKDIIKVTTYVERLEQCRLGECMYVFIISGVWLPSNEAMSLVSFNACRMQQKYLHVLAGNTFPASAPRYQFHLNETPVLCGQCGCEQLSATFAYTTFVSWCQKQPTINSQYAIVRSSGSRCRPKSSALLQCSPITRHLAHR